MGSHANHLVSLLLLIGLTFNVGDASFSTPPDQSQPLSLFRRNTTTPCQIEPSTDHCKRLGETCNRYEGPPAPPCAFGSVCYSDVFSGDGTCAKVLEGRSCEQNGQRTCDNNGLFEPSLTCLDGICQVDLEQMLVPGDKCGSDEQCKGEGKCKSSRCLGRSEGEYCTFGSDFCSMELICINVQGTGYTCQLPADDDSACSNSDECDIGSYCIASQCKLEYSVENSMQCDGVHSVCRSGYCGNDGLCQDIDESAIGQECTNSSECANALECACIDTLGQQRCTPSQSIIRAECASEIQREARCLRECHVNSDPLISDACANDCIDQVKARVLCVETASIDAVQENGIPASCKAVFSGAIHHIPFWWNTDDGIWFWSSL